jgi:ribA/ribD-fused uncharacterized protein
MKSKKDKFVFFWGGTFSQWATSKFEIDGVEYNCCEQYMMAKKALVFNDFDACREIMLEKQPALQKAIGRKVRGFNVSKWEPVCRKIVYDANMAKFTQNPKMLEELLATEGREIVEASPEDKIWGIGLHETNPLAWDKETWQGLNLLGEAIMKVRDTITKELAQADYQ